jgi:hypothetical protein
MAGAALAAAQISRRSDSELLDCFPGREEFGQDSLSIAAAGARVTGVDIGGDAIVSGPGGLL